VESPLFGESFCPKVSRRLSLLILICRSRLLRSIDSATKTRRSRLSALRHRCRSNLGAYKQFEHGQANPFPFSRGVATGGISGYIPPKSVYLNFFCGCFVSLTQDKFDIVQFIPPNQIPGYASALLFLRSSASTLATIITLLRTTKSMIITPEIKNNLHLPSVNLYYGSKAISFKGCNLWNQLPEDIKNIKILLGLSVNLGNYFIVACLCVNG